MKTALVKQDDGTIQLTVTIPLDSVRKTWEETLEEFTKQTTLPGFRKGKAPKNLVAEQVDNQRLQEETLKKLLPQAYANAVREHNLKPFITPKIHVEKLDNPTEQNAKDWQFTALTCEAPDVQLNDYKNQIQKISGKSKIIIPGKEPKKEAKFDEIADALLKSVTVTVPKLLIEQEADRLLSQTLDEIKKLGLTLDQYLASTGRTPQDIRKEYETKAENDIKFELALQKIGTEEHLTVEEKEIDEAIQKAKDENEKKHMQANRYLLASILRQQKTLDFLKNL